MSAAAAVSQHLLPMIGAARPSMPVDGAENAASTLLNSADLAAAIGQALSRAGLTHKQGCAFMDLDPGLWSRQLQGDGHISLQRLMRLPSAFWMEFVPLLAQPVGLTCSHEDMASRALLQAAQTVEALTRTVIQLQQRRNP